jgi:hypothetical protein
MVFKFFSFLFFDLKGRRISAQGFSPGSGWCKDLAALKGQGSHFTLPLQGTNYRLLDIIRLLLVHKNVCYIVGDFINVQFTMYNVQINANTGRGVACNALADTPTKRSTVHPYSPNKRHSHRRGRCPHRPAVPPLGGAETPNKRQ